MLIVRCCSLGVVSYIAIENTYLTLHFNLNPWPRTANTSTVQRRHPHPPPFATSRNSNNWIGDLFVTYLLSSVMVYAPTVSRIHLYIQPMNIYWASTTRQDNACGLHTRWINTFSPSRGRYFTCVIVMQSRRFQMIWGIQNETQYLCPQVAYWT